MCHVLGQPLSLPCLPELQKKENNFYSGSVYQHGSDFMRQTPSVCDVRECVRISLRRVILILAPDIRIVEHNVSWHLLKASRVLWPKAVSLMTGCLIQCISLKHYGLQDLQTVTLHYMLSKNAKLG